MLSAVFLLGGTVGSSEICYSLKCFFSGVFTSVGWMAASGLWDQNCAEEDLQHIGGGAAVCFIYPAYTALRRLWVWLESSGCRVSKVHVLTCRGLCFTCTIQSFCFLSLCFSSGNRWKEKECVEYCLLNIPSLNQFNIIVSHVRSKHWDSAPDQFIGVSYRLVRFTQSLPQLETCDTCISSSRWELSLWKHSSLLSADSKKALW